MFWEDTNAQEIFEDMSVNGCDSLIDIDIIFVDQVITTIEQDLCEDEELMINNTIYSVNNPNGSDTLQSIMGCDSILIIDLQFDLFGMGEFISTLCPGESIDIGSDTYDSTNLNGTTVLSNASSNGCDSIVMVDIELLGEAFSVLDQDICPGQSVTIGNDTYDENNLTGSTTLTGQANNGCDSIVDVTLNLLSAVSFDLMETICPGESISVGTDIYDENILSGSTTLVGQSVNGCDSIVNVNLELAMPLAEIEAPVLCPEDTTGELTISGVSDMSLPISVILDGVGLGSFVSFPITVSAVPGSHEIMLIDDNGCIYEEFISVDLISGLDAQVITDQLGTNQFNLSYNATFNTSSAEWISSGALSCNFCDASSIIIDQDTELTLLLVSEEGCEISQTVILNYTAPRDSMNYFIPNIISLSDISNNAFTIYSDEDVNIEEVSIYDRWGNLMYTNNKLTNPEVIWDGRMNDRLVEQGVYVYKIDLLSSDHEIIQMIGNLTIIR